MPPRFFSLAVPFRDAAAHVRPELNLGDLADQDRDAVGAKLSAIFFSRRGSECKRALAG